MTAPSYEKRSIPTVYNGQLFRSKLEADWARAFDALKIEWRYETVGHYFGDVFYLPDFWLPRSRQYVEVKGVFEPEDCRKIQALLRHVRRRPNTNPLFCPDISIVACVPDGKFYGWARTDPAIDDWFEFLTKASRVVDLMSCARCHGWWFADPDGSWQCQCCGASDGNGHLAGTVSSPLPEFPNVHALHFLAPNV